MQLSKCILSALTLSGAMFFATAAMAAQLPKHGTFSGTYYSFGTAKATAIGKERRLIVFDENGLSLSNGFMDHMTWHCWGMADFTNGMGPAQGYCVGTDPAGDQLALNWADEKHALGQKSFRGSAKLTTGTGKLAGVSGEFTYVTDLGFRPTIKGTYLSYVTFQGNYKLP